MEHGQQHLTSSPRSSPAIAPSFMRKVSVELGVRARPLLRLGARLAVTVPFAALLLGAAPVLAQVSLGAAADFAVLGGSAVTCTDSAIEGDVGVDLGPVTLTNCTISGTVHVGDTAAQQAYDDFLVAYDALEQEPCDVNLTGQSLAGLSLTPGVYCFDAAVAETGGELILSGPTDGVWIFKIGVLGTGALTATEFTVSGPGEVRECTNNVFWWTAEAATLTDSDFLGNILAGTSITVTRGSLAGQALAKAAVTLTGTSVCGPEAQPGTNFHGKVTGGGQIPVPDPNSSGRATFGFNAKGNDDGSASGHFNYLNHVTGLHVGGPVDLVVVLATNPDGSAKTIQFSGTCGGNLPDCFFSVTVEDHGEPGRSDEFGITVTGAQSEVTSQRVISRGNIQFHEK